MKIGDYVYWRTIQRSEWVGISPTVVSGRVISFDRETTVILSEDSQTLFAKTNELYMDNLSAWNQDAEEKVKP